GSWTSKNFCLAAARQGQSTKINRDIQKTASRNLKQYAAEVLEDPRYQKSFLGDQSIKTDRELTPFDCIQAPCSTTCPTHQEVPSYMRHTAAGDFDKALEVILRTNPFPAITGMVCDHQCMSKCTRINYDNPLQIREIKNFIRTNHKKEPQIQPVPKKGLKAAVIGAGPAGLSCAYFLALGGFAVEVYEAEAFPGGMAARAIPAFRLRQEDITQDIRRIEHTGINIHYNTRVDQKLFNDLKKENDYIFIGVGAGRSSRLNIPGENLENVNDALSFLAAVRRGEKISPAEKTAVIGGGSSAVDAARTAYRLSGEKGEVSIIYRRTRAEMPACTEEIEAAQHEGIGLLELTAPISIEKTGAGAGADLKLTCSKMKLGEKDRSGRRRPLPIENSLFDLYFDRIICAVGQQVDLDFLDSAATAELLKSSDFVPTRKLKKSAGAALRKQARETKEQAGGELNKQAIFFGGDALHGPGNLITAVADGRKAAERILPPAAKNLFEKRFLDLQKLPISRCAADDPVQQRQAAKREYGIEPQELPPQKRKNFETYRADFSETEAVKEAGRCLSCDQLCDVCVSVCPNRANISYRIEPVEYRLQQAVRQGEKIVIQDGELFKVEQEHQVLHMVDFCNACGNCRTFCPTAGAPYLDKPRFCLSEESFAREEGVYFFCREDSKRLIKWKPGQTAHRYSGNRELSKSFAGDPGGFYNEQRSMVNGQWFNKSEDNTPYRVPAPRVPLVAEGKKTIETLYLDGDEFVYRAEGIFARLDSGTFAIKEIEFLFPGIEAAGFRKAAEMSLLLRFSPSYLLVNE
ncbi:MAG: FAD-dependent oxidoreductase, partial [Candidatus Aminicenantes bacterium]|nr:FAD-dependent oxidoreductase [Candidatus Aminicenantes bacterium]